MPRTILIADDDPLNLELLTTLAESVEDVVVLAAADGLAAHALAIQSRPDLLLLDVEMPGLTGIEVCQQVRADPALSTSRIILLTANVTPAVREQAEAAGADDFIPKPFDSDKLLARIRAALDD